MSGPVWSPDTGLSKITEDVEQTFPNDVFLDKNLRDRTNFNTSTPRRTQSYREISNVDAGRVPDRRSLSLSNTGMMYESDTKDAEESWTMWTKRAESLTDLLPHKRSIRSHSFSVGSNNEDDLLSPQSVSDSTVNLENIEPKLRRASLQCHAAITGVNLQKRGSSVFENMDISSTSPNPLHAVLMQYALSRKSGNIKKIQRKDNSAETKCTNNNSESDSHFIPQSVIKKTNSANEVTTVFDVISKCDKMTKEYDGRLSHSKSTSYSTSDVCQNKNAKPEKKNKQYSPNARKQRAKNVDEQAESTCQRPTLDTACRAGDLFQSYNQQKYELSKKTDTPTSRQNSNRHTSNRQKSHDHSEHARKPHNSEQSLEYVSKADQSNQLRSECTETTSTVISNDDYPKRLLTLTRNKDPHNLTKDLPTAKIDLKYSLLNTEPLNDTHPENNPLSSLDDSTTSPGHGKISPINSLNISDIEMVSDVFSFSSADLIDYSSQSPQQQKFTSIASDEGFVTCPPSLVSTNSIQALSIGNETSAFHSKSLSIASDEGYSASPPPSPKQKRTARLRSSIISRKETRISERSGSKTKTKDKPTRSFKQTAV